MLHHLIDLENRKKCKYWIYILIYVTMLIVKYFEYHPWKGPILEPAKGPVAVFTTEGGIFLLFLKLFFIGV